MCDISINIICHPNDEVQNKIPLIKYISRFINNSPIPKAVINRGIIMDISVPPRIKPIINETEIYMSELFLKILMNVILFKILIN